MPARPRPWATTAALVLALALGACSSSPEESEADACAAMGEYQSALDGFARALTPQATVEELRTARESVESARSELDEALSSVEADRVAGLDDAWQSLADTVDDLDGEATVADAVAVLQGGAENVQSARADLSAAIDCG